MTAEIAVMNKWAVALAADSKVTISGMRASKAYDTVNKLFTLSKIHPVGIMIFGNAEWMEYPWETIIKIYRDRKGRANEKTVEDWGKDFIEFLETFGKVDDHHKSRNFQNMCVAWLGQSMDFAIAEAQDRSISFGSDDFIKLLQDLFVSRSDAFIDNGQWLNVTQQKAIVKKYAKQMSETIRHVLGNFENEELNKAAAKFLVSSLFYNQCSPQSSGVVIAGFGDDELFPSLIEYETDGYIGSKIKTLQKGPVADVSRSMSSCIRAFAQGDMVERFMNGVDSGFFSVLTTAFQDTLQQNCLSILEKYGKDEHQSDAVKQEVVKASEDAIEALHKGAADYVEANFSDPVIGMVALLPKDELAHLAKSLVALTSLKRRVSSDAETVGGPIDVALISKGDGFVWIERKHYFPAELNHQFARNYMNTLLDGEQGNEARKQPISNSRSAKARPRAGALKKKPSSKGA